MLKIRTMPEVRALPMVVRPPYAEADGHEEMMSPPDWALGRETPFWMYLRVMLIRLPEGVPESVLNWVMMVKGLVVSTVSPGP
jgi:hypothetical protein